MTVKMTQAYAVNLVHQFGASSAWPHAEQIAQRMVDKGECVAHAAAIVMGWPECMCSPCKRARRTRS